MLYVIILLTGIVRFLFYSFAIKLKKNKFLILTLLEKLSAEETRLHSSIRCIEIVASK